ncbi:MAG: hypothetical protein KDJ66_02640, partial [Nitratireductor sp.]|nr:hypothetical protein [Nitratireductor sp.]
YATLFAANAEGSGVSFRQLGEFGADRLEIGTAISISVRQLREAHESWFPDFMDGGTGMSQAAE